MRVVFRACKGDAMNGHTEARQADSEKAVAVASQGAEKPGAK